LKNGGRRDRLHSSPSSRISRVNAIPLPRFTNLTSLAKLNFRKVKLIFKLSYKKPEIIKLHAISVEQASTRNQCGTGLFNDETNDYFDNEIFDI